MIKLKDLLSEDHHDKKEGKMAKYDAKEIADDAMDVFKMIDKNDDLPEWLEAKITIAAHNMNTVKDYLTHHQSKKVDQDIGFTPDPDVGKNHYVAPKRDTKGGMKTFYQKFSSPEARTIIDGSLTNVIGKNMGKISAWYDNEWGFSNRMCDIAEHLHKNS